MSVAIYDMYMTRASVSILCRKALSCLYVNKH